MKPLEGIKVVELATFVAAPGAGRLFAEWGAEVVKVESLKGDANRTLGLLNKMPIDVDENPSFDAVSYGKKFVSINTKDPKGMEILHQLLAKADVFITNYRTKVLENMGLDYDSLSKIYPGLIFAQVLGYGEVGPEKDTPGYDYTTYGARGGLLGTTYQKGGEPINIMSAFGDFQTSICLACGTLAAVVAKKTTGKGDKVTASLHNAGLYMNNWAILGEYYATEPTFPKSRKEANTPSINTYKASDRWIQICGADYNRYYNPMMKVIGREDLVDSDRFKDLKTIQANGDNIEVVKIIEEAIATKTADEWIAAFRAAEVPAEKAYTFTDVLNDPQARATKAIDTIKYDNGHEGIVVANPIRMGSLGDPVYETSKRVGFHTKAILEAAGYSEEELTALEEAKVIKM